MAGRCIAGKEWQNGKPGGWVRPVSARPTHEVSEKERCYESKYEPPQQLPLFFKKFLIKINTYFKILLKSNKKIFPIVRQLTPYRESLEPQLLDILLVPCDSHQPLSHQRENHVIDPDSYWQKQGRLLWEDIQSWIDTPTTLWNLGPRSYSGLNNRVATGQENGTSLYLISVERLCLLVGPKAPEYSDFKRTVRGEFVYRGTKYRMDVTDPVVERNYLPLADGQYDILRPVLCISLGDPYKGYFYKLIAAVLYPERFA